MMSRHKTKWIKAEDLPEHLRDMVGRFEQAFHVHSTGYKIVNLLDYGIWFQRHGRCSAYALARLALNSPDCYVELIASAPGYYTVAMWKSQEGMRGDLGIERAKCAFDPDYQITTGIRVRV